MSKILELIDLRGMPKTLELPEFEKKYGLTDAKDIYELIGARAKGDSTEDKFEEFAKEVSNAVHMDLIAFEEKYDLPECIAKGVFDLIDADHSGHVTHAEYVMFVRKLEDADAGTIADIFIAITKRDHDGDISRAEIKAMLSVKDDKTLNSDVVNKLITVIFPHKPEDPTPDSMTVKEFKEMIVNRKGGVKVLRDNMLTTLTIPKSGSKSAAHRGPRPEPAWCTNPEAGCSPAWMWHNWDGIFLHSALLGVFIYRYHQFYHGEGAGQHPISIAKGAGLALLFGIFALYLTKLRMLQWLNCIPFWAKVLTVSRRTACLA